MTRSCQSDLMSACTNSIRSELSALKWTNSSWARIATALSASTGIGHCGAVIGPIAARKSAIATGSKLITPFTFVPPHSG